MARRKDCMPWKNSCRDPDGSKSTYTTWNSMLFRCNDPQHHDYRLYGGRGIKVCERWLSWDNFVEDMGHRPKGLTLDRIDNDGPYEPSNCRWASLRQNNNNRRCTRFVEAFGERLPLAEMAEKHGIGRGTLRLRLNAGWSPERALSKAAAS